MRKPLLASSVEFSGPGVLIAALMLYGLAGWAAPAFAQQQMPPPGYIQNPAYVQNPGYPAGNGGAYDPYVPPNNGAYAPQGYPSGNSGGYAPGPYQPPTVTAPGAVRPKGKKGTPSRASASNTTPGPLTVKVNQLERNDERQDQRLNHLERDVSNLRAGAGPVESGHYISKPLSSSGPATKLHTVREGETLWRIAAKYSTSVNAIRSANRISGNSVSVGQTLMIPIDGGADVPAPQPAASSNVHIVKTGQTFEEIARMYKVSPDSLARANPSAYPDKLLVGEKLTIPGRKAVASSASTQAPAYYPPAVGKGSVAKSAAPAKAGTHTVKPGESLGAIAKSYGIPTARLAAANKIKNPDLVEVGRVLVIPGGGAGAVAQGTVKKTTPPAKGAVASTAPASAGSDTIPLPGAGMPLAKPAPVQPPVKPTPPPGLVEPPTYPATASTAPAKKSPPVGAHRGVVAYRLERGDDIDSVANMFSTTPDRIREINKLPAGSKVKEGDEVIVPAMGPVSLN